MLRKKQIKYLKVNDGDGSGTYRTVLHAYKGNRPECYLKDQFGKEYYGINLTINMPDKDITLTPTVIPFGENFAKGKAHKQCENDAMLHMFDGCEVLYGLQRKW